jgi:hypothetical protein
MDVHKESIDIALAEMGGEVRHHGRIGGDLNALTRGNSRAGVGSRWWRPYRPVAASSSSTAHASWPS